MELISALGGVGAAFGLSTSAGLNAYIPLLIVALGSRFPLGDPLLQLAEPYNLLGNWIVIAVLLILLLIEVTVDKIPAVDTVNDVVQTVVRPAAGAVLFAANADVITGVNPVIALVAGLILAGGVHTTKGVVRPAVTTTTAGTGNWFVSIVEDLIAFVVSVLSILVPIIMSVLLVIIIAYTLTWFFRRRRRRQKLSSRSI